MTAPAATVSAERDETFLRRAFRLAMTGRGRVEPNPMVGCVLVRDGRIIGEGYHTHWGGPHAEPTALADCAARGEGPAGATAYVTLEPCCHTNKKTPPCAPRLIAAKVVRVVIGCLDPNPAVNGNGVAMLRAAGIRVDGPVLEAEAKQLISPFLKSQGSGRPYVTMKWAETADGKVAGPGGRRMQISNPAASRLVHQLRARSDGIVVGIGTVLADDPLLTARGVEAARPLRRFVLDTHLRSPPDSQLVRTARTVPLVVSASPAARNDPARAGRVAELRAAGVKFLDDDDGVDGRINLREFLGSLIGDVYHLLAEPGPTLARSLFPWADRLWVFRSPRRADDDTAPAAAPIPAGYAETGRLDVEGDTLTEYLNRSGEAFHTTVPSADFVLATEDRMTE
ncbi:MAG: riboflavin biosynthesis protein RibD [Phycisphaerales bacterium]|nr:riboflavin biosynthesis protein RibD [Phycisphaerales bacterium]